MSGTTGRAAEPADFAGDTTGAFVNQRLSLFFLSFFSLFFLLVARHSPSTKS